MSERGAEAGMSGDEERLRGELSAVLDLIRGVGAGWCSRSSPNRSRMPPGPI